MAFWKRWKNILAAVKSLDQSPNLIQKTKIVIVQTSLSSLEKKVLDIDIPKDKFNNLCKEGGVRLIFFENWQHYSFKSCWQWFWGYCLRGLWEGSQWFL